MNPYATFLPFPRRLAVAVACAAPENGARASAIPPKREGRHPLRAQTRSRLPIR